MPKKYTYLQRRHPDSKFIRSFIGLVDGQDEEYTRRQIISARVTRGAETWDWDSLEELAHNIGVATEYDALEASVLLNTEDFSKKISLMVRSEGRVGLVSVGADNSTEVERLHDRLVSELKELPELEGGNELKPEIFVGHGRSVLWRELKDHLQDRHSLRVRAFETADRSGHTIRDILSEELGRANFAFMVMTAEDEQGDGNFRARQNVIHEAGLFQGKLGFDRVVLLVEDGVENFSNVAGIQYIPFSKGNIREAFGDAVAAVRAKFGF